MGSCAKRRTRLHPALAAWRPPDRHTPLIRPTFGFKAPEPSPPARAPRAGSRGLAERIPFDVAFRQPHTIDSHAEVVTPFQGHVFLDRYPFSQNEQMTAPDAHCMATARKSSPIFDKIAENWQFVRIVNLHLRVGAPQKDQTERLFACRIPVTPFPGCPLIFFHLRFPPLPHPTSRPPRGPQRRYGRRG